MGDLTNQKTASQMHVAPWIAIHCWQYAQFPQYFLNIYPTFTQHFRKISPRFPQDFELHHRKRIIVKILPFCLFSKGCCCFLALFQIKGSQPGRSSQLDCEDASGQPEMWQFEIVVAASANPKSSLPRPGVPDVEDIQLWVVSSGRNPDLCIPLSLTLILFLPLCPCQLSTFVAKYEMNAQIYTSLSQTSRSRTSCPLLFCGNPALCSDSAWWAHFSALLAICDAGMYIDEVGSYAAFVRVRPAYIRSRLPPNSSGPFTTTAPLPVGAGQLMKNKLASLIDSTSLSETC